MRLAAIVEWPESAALGWQPSEFAHVYADNREVAVREAVEDNPLAKAVGVMAERAERWAASSFGRPFARRQRHVQTHGRLSIAVSS